MVQLNVISPPPSPPEVTEVTKRRFHGYGKHAAGYYYYYYHYYYCYYYSSKLDLNLQWARHVALAQACPNRWVTWVFTEERFTL